MNRKELYKSFREIDDDILERSESAAKHNKKPLLLKGCIAAACLCLIIGVLAKSSGAGKDTKPGEILLSERTTAKISYGHYESTEGTEMANKNALLYLTEEEMFTKENMYVFRGIVRELTNIIIDFNGEKEGRCIATIVIEEVYKGEISAEEEISVLLPCSIESGKMFAEDTGIIAQLKIGMEGIFMPVVYDQKDAMGRNGAVLVFRDLASCGISDGMRWVFLSTDRGVHFARFAYSGAKDAVSLDDIEAYVLKMLK